MSFLWNRGDLLQNNVSVYSVICHRLSNVRWEPIRVAFSELSILPFLVSPIWPWLGWLALLVAGVNYSTPTELPGSYPQAYLGPRSWGSGPTTLTT